MKVSVVCCGPAVNESERKAINQLKTRLISVPGDGEWRLLTNLAFSATHRLQSDEIDIVAIGPPGVRIIEVKHWTAAWVNRHQSIVELEAEKLTNKARKIGTTLRRQFPYLPRVDGTFLVTEAAPKVKPLEKRESVRGVSFHTFKTWEGAVGFGSLDVLTSEQIAELSGFLQPRTAIPPDGDIRRLAGYTRLQLRTPPDEHFHRIYSAAHASRQDRVVLHLYDLSADSDSHAGERAEREWKSLHRLQRYGWAPRIVDSFQDVQGYADEIKFFTVADPAAPAISERNSDDTWDTKARLRFARSAIEALSELHESGPGGEPMVHRNLTPRTILVRHDNTPILTGFEYARIPAEVTVGSMDCIEDWDPEVAPEVREHGLGGADPLSDLYSLCASLSMLFDGREDEASLKGAEALARGLETAPGKRISLEQLKSQLSEIAGEPISKPPPPPARYWTEDQVIPFRDQHYRIISRLGSGGVGTAYKVVKIDRKTQGDLGTYVAKVARDGKMGKRVLDAYQLAHSHLRHSALSTIFEVASEWQNNSFVALMTWIEGSPLGEYAGVLPILAEDLDEESGESLALRWLRTACEALSVLHGNGLVHGDLSPRNMIVSGNSLVITDYDCVTKIGTPAATPGTVMYCSPSRREGLRVAPSDDMYALAASFFHVLFDEEPFRQGGNRPNGRRLNWDGVPRDEYLAVASFLDRATNPNASERFATTTEALAALGESLQVKRPGKSTPVEGRPETSKVKSLTSFHPEGDPTERRENEVPWLRLVLQSYPGSPWGNTETRGLDSEFAAKTYVETKLEQVLHSEIVERRVNLVILSGNAGDGKTALLQHLARKLGLGDHRSEARILEGQLDSGLTVRMNLDGSASWKGRSADQLLDNFLAPFQHGRPTDSVVHLLAINDGRLLEWIESVQDRIGETPLTTDLLEFLQYDTVPSASHIRFINLNQRSLVGGVKPDGTNGEKSIDTSFLHRLVDNLYGGKDAETNWAPCRTCVAQESCKVFEATKIFGPGKLADENLRNRARKRLFHALQAVHLRGETHITVRELRGTLVYILFGIHYCRDYHEKPVATGMPGPQLYSERAFSPRSHGRQGEVLRELVRFDPALDAHPQVDRRLLHPSPVQDNSGLSRYDGYSLQEARRRAYFEWPESEVRQLTGHPHALDLARGSHLREFLSLATTRNAGDQRKLAKRLCIGISRLETLPPKAFDRRGFVSLRITPRTPTETAFWVEKSIDRFRLEVEISDGSEGLDQLHRQAFLTYRYQDQDGREERLRLGAELFHLLLELSDGYQLGDVATDDTFAHLSIFVQRLVQEGHRQMFAWNPMREETIFEVSARIEDAESDPRQRTLIAPFEQPVESRAD